MSRSRNRRREVFIAAQIRKGAAMSILFHRWSESLRCGATSIADSLLRPRNAPRPPLERSYEAIDALARPSHACYFGLLTGIRR
jgi:hypothetical protein